MGDLNVILIATTAKNITLNWTYLIYTVHVDKEWMQTVMVHHYNVGLRSNKEIQNNNKSQITR